ncbi:MAG TPA: carboxypeptidase-like regulatory domain-containing protein, partial [Thermoanaerobaculia bacterium]|nr:carboxypeptidase-like regulatory domain-containing protein [Thermoanaerobaculia bacterium]
MRSAAVLLALSLILASFPAHSAITGSVFDEGGKPAAGIHVVAYQPEGNDDLIARLCSKSPRRPVVAEAVTDANGTYIIDVSGNGEIDLSVVEAGTIPVSIRHDLAEASAAPLALHRGNVIEGTVTDGKKPVADALVVARGYNASAETITGADGHYRLTEPARWAQMLIVMHPSFAPATLPPSQSRIVLEPGITATGRVTGPDGKGVAAKITVGRWPAGESGENGTFTIQHLPRRSKIIEASTPLLTGQTAISSSGSTTIALRPSASVSVIVRDTQSKPVQGLVVWLAADDAIRSAATDIHGAVEFRDLAQRKYEINAAGDSATFTIDGAEVDLRKVNAIKREITAKRQPAFSGIVHDDEGTPVAKATIYISPGDDAFPGYRADLRAAAARFPVAVTGAQGTFRFRAPSFGTDSFRIEAGKRGQPIGPAVAVKGGAEGRSGIALVIPKGIEVSGRVTSDGKAVESVRVSLGAARDIPISAGDSIWATTDTDGQFSGRLAAGATTLGFQRDNFFSKVTQIEVSEKTPRIEIALESAVTITGRVTNHDGSPAAGVMVMAQSASPAGEQPSVSDSDGTFS